MRHPCQDLADHLPGLLPDACRPGYESFGRPLSVLAMGLGTMLLAGYRRTFGAVAALVAGHPLPCVKHLHGAAGPPDFHALADECARHAVESVLTLHVVVDVHPAFLPLRKLVARQW